MPVGIVHCDVAGAIDSGSQRRIAGIFLLIVEHQPGGPRLELDAHLALAGLAVIAIQDTNAIAG